MKHLLTEKYRPKTLSEYVFRDERQKKQCERWIKEGVLPHLMLSGSTGTGKTTLARCLLHELDVPKSDILFLNASHESSVDVIRDKVVGFVSTMGFGDMKYVFLDEADQLSPSAQGVLRGVMEQYSTIARFIFTCNYPNKIIDAIHGRCQGFHIDKLDQQEFLLRVGEILMSESVKFDIDTLQVYVKATYPNLRKCLNAVQQNYPDGTLLMPLSSDTSSQDDYKLAMVELFKQGKIKEARKLITDQFRAEEVEDLFRFFYSNLDFWGDSDEQQQAAILAIRDGLVNHRLVGDPEINLSATLIELNRIRNGE
ncbi:MAG: AAA family ATPase [Candidimonas sp.]